MTTTIDVMHRRKSDRIKLDEQPTSSLTRWVLGILGVSIAAAAVLVAAARMLPL